MLGHEGASFRRVGHPVPLPIDKLFARNLRVNRHWLASRDNVLVEIPSRVGRHGHADGLVRQARQAGFGRDEVLGLTCKARGVQIEGHIRPPIHTHASFRFRVIARRSLRRRPRAGAQQH